MKFPKPWYRKGRGWFVTLNGRQVSLGKQRVEALQRYQELMVVPQQPRVQSQSLLVLIDAFLDWCQKHRAPDTYEWYRYRLQCFATAYPKLRATELRPFHVQRWFDDMNVATGSKRNFGRAVKRCVRWAKQQGYIDSNPIEDLELPSPGQRNQVVTEEDWQTILDHVPEGGFRDLLNVTWHTGCRPQESLRVEGRHVDLVNQRWVFPKSEAKGRRAPRIVYLTELSVRITERLMSQNRDGALFRNRNGRPWTKDSVNCAFTRLQIRMGRKAMQRNGDEIPDSVVTRSVRTLSPFKRSDGKTVLKSELELRSEARRKLTNKRARELAPKYSLYALRHTWATRALQSGLDGLTVAILMGHSDPSTLAKVYQHLSHSPEHLLDQARRVSSS